MTFAASSRNSLDKLSHEGEGADEDDEDWDVFSLDYNRELRASDTSTSEKPSPHPSGRTPSADRFAATFALFSYSNGHVLEDDASLSWYNLRPYELVELHRLGTVVALPRSPVAYAAPYFDSRVLVLDTAVAELDGAARRMRRKKPEERRAEWKARWVVVRDGVLAFCKDVVVRVRFSRGVVRG